jgi:hypothetical protein
MMPMRGGEGKQSYANDRQWAETKEHHKGAAKIFAKQEIYRQHYSVAEPQPNLT